MSGEISIQHHIMISVHVFKMMGRRNKDDLVRRPSPEVNTQGILVCAHKCVCVDNRVVGELP